jgi:hypothetical protein
VTTQEKISVLILQDDPMVLKSIGLAIRGLVPDAVIHAAASVIEAQQISAEERIHFYIIQADLAHGAGLDFLCDLRTVAPEARFASLAANLAPEQEQQLQQLGVLEHFKLPLDVSVLARLVQTHYGYMTSGTGQLDAKGEFAVSLTCPSCLDIIQLKCLGSATLVLQVSSGHGAGRIYFDHGDIFHAETAKLHGERAFERILRWKGGRIKELALEKKPERTITTNWQGLLLKVAQHIDESVATH